MRSFLLTLAFSLLASGRPTTSIIRQNGKDAVALKYREVQNLKSQLSLRDRRKCLHWQEIRSSKFAITACAPGTICAALPLVNAPGTSVTCTTQADTDARIAATRATAGDAAAPPPDNSNNNNGGGNNGGNNTDAGGAAAGANSDPQKSLTLDPGVIAKGFANDGQDPPVAGQVASLTSTNNFINFCKTVNLPITNGQQILDGSCNPAPMGAIPSKTKMPSSKFIFPANGATIKVNTPFTIKMAIKNMETGNFVNADTNYFAAPQQLNANGLIKGHSHAVIEKLTSLDQTTPNDPTMFAFFKGLNGKADAQGVLTADVSKGLPAGIYKLSSINAASNHQPVLAPIAQHGSLDDTVYFTIQ